MLIGVTGARGEVGQGVVNHLLDCGYEVRGITHRPWEDSPIEDVHVLDIESYEAVEAALSPCDRIIHLAGIRSPVGVSDVDVLRTNLIGTYNVLLSAGRTGTDRVAIASSDCTFGYTFTKNRPELHYLPVDEEHPTRPDDSYGLSKVLIERTAEAMVQRFAYSVASLRISWVIEPDKYDTEEFDRLTRDPEAGYYNFWSYIDLRDAARAFRMAIEKHLSGHEVFQIAARDTRLRTRTAKLIDRYFPDVERKIDFDGFQSLEDSRKAARLLGFTPQYSWRG